MDQFTGKSMFGRNLVYSGAWIMPAQSSCFDRFGGPFRSISGPAHVTSQLRVILPAPVNFSEKGPDQVDLICV